MKRIGMLLLIMGMVCSFGTVVFADGKTQITTQVPEASYELVIPADQTIPFGQRETIMDAVSVENSTGFLNGKYVKAQISYGPLVSEDGDEIVYYLRSQTDSSSSVDVNGQAVIFENDGAGGVKQYGYILDPSDNFRFRVDKLGLFINEEKWNAANPGSYKSTITFTSEIVSP